MACLSELLSAGIIEKDINNDVLWTWTYPSLSQDLKTLLINKCNALNGSSHGHNALTFCYCHHRDYWFYLHFTDAVELEKLPKLKQFVLVLQSRDFNPEKYEHLSRILSRNYSQTGNPADMLRLYLSVLVRGICRTEDNGTFSVNQFEQEEAYSCVPAKDIVKMFGLETILIYTAILLKKHIVVYHHRLEALLLFVRSLPAFVWHRQDWSIVYPFMQLTEAEISELSSIPAYIAGFRDAAIESHTELYDLFVNLPAIEITIAAHSKEIFTMTKTHKEIAVFMTRLAEDTALDDKSFIKEVSNKTNDLLKSLRTFVGKNDFGEEVLKLSLLKEKGFPVSIENFLKNLATAEGLMLD